jgi:hypothetical protein
MRNRSLSTLAIALVVSLAAAGCAGDGSVAPTSAMTPPSAASNSLLGGLLGSTQTITPLLRTTAMTADSVSVNIGILGGVISLPSRGLTIVVPPLAVSSTKTFKIKALAGQAVAYEFEPHGTKFLVPLVATQSLVGTQAATGGLVNPLSLKLGYFPNSSNITSVTELLTVGVNLLGQTAVSTIWHFSGYIYAGADDGAF